MRVDPFAQRQLLDVQRLDTQADTLRHRLSNLPEDAELARGEQRRRELSDRSRDLKVLVSDLTTEQKRADRDVEQVKTRRERDRSRLESGQVSNPKDAERMQHELVSLERRINELEDVELEVMQRLEDAANELERVEAEVGQAEEEAAMLTRTRDEKADQLRAEIEETSREREATASGVPEELIRLYERLRSSKGGVGAAELRARQCGGCRLSLDTAELASFARAPSDEVLRCEECSRILVRTSESGL